MGLGRNTLERWLLPGGSVGAHLDVVVLGAGDHQVLVGPGLVHGQTHDWAQVADELPSGGEPAARRRGLKAGGQLDFNYSVLFCWWS